MEHFPRIGILYLTYGTKHWEQDINRCLTSLEAMTYPKDRVELICIESKAWNTGILVKDWFEKTWMPKSMNALPRITYVFNDRKMGFAENNNAGYAKAKELGCDYVYLLNEDTDVDPDFLLRAVERAESDPKIAVVQSLLLLGEQRNEVNTIGNAYHFLGFGYSLGYHWTRAQAEAHLETERKTNPDLEIGYATGAAMLARVSALQQCGGLFDNDFFMYHEDTDASFRPRIAGWKVVIEPRSVVYHFYEFVKSRWIYFYMDRNRYVMMFSFYRLWTIFLLMPMIIVMDLGLLGFSFIRGWWREKFKVYGALISPSFWQWIRQRQTVIQRIRTVSDRELLRMTVSDVAFQEEAIKNPVLDYIANPITRAYWWVARNLLY